jgi:outer membrane protein
VAPVIAMAVLAGCSNPLWPKASDRGRQVPVERLREIEAGRIERFERARAAGDAGRAVAPPGQAPGPEDPARAAKERFAGLAEVPLSIAEARASALEHNLDMKVALVDPTIAEARVRVEEARFEAAFTTRALWQETDTPTSSRLSSSQVRFRQLEPGVTIPLRTGGTATVSLPITKTESNSEFASLNPAYTSDLNFSIAQPLLRNAGRGVNTVAIEIANYNRQISEAETKLAIINQLSAVDRAYWRLYQSRRNLEVRQQDYELAQTQLQSAQRTVNAGRQSEIEVIRSQSGVADRLGSILTAQNNVLLFQRELKRVINQPGLDLENRTLVVPATEPAPVEYVFDPNALMVYAEQNRMEMLELELRLLADAASIRLDRNQLLPKLDLDASYRVNGLGRSSQDSWRLLEGHGFADWSVGATLEVPLGNEGAKNRLRQSVLTRLQRLTSRESRKLLIRQEVLDATDRIEAGWQRVLATRQATILSTRSLQAEQRQFDLGASTSTDVLLSATSLAEARLLEVQAVVDYQLAQVDLAAATGVLLGAAKIRWTPSEPDRAGGEVTGGVNSVRTEGARGG